jgi:hypothetical protein
LKLCPVLLLAVLWLWPVSALLAAEDSVNSEAQQPVAQPSEIPLESEPLPESSPGADVELTAPMPFNAPFSQQNFVPDISLILDFSAGIRNLDNAAYADLQSPLMLQGKTTGHAHHFNALNGFNLNYAELTLQAPADPFLDMFATFHVSPTEIEIEEAYVVSRGLPAHFQIKAGKFLSHFGRLNAQHAHFWNFATRPAIYSSVFGSESLNEMGAQVSWLAPIDTYLNLGLEVLQGVNSESFGTQAFQSGTWQLKEVNHPNLFTLWAKSSLDLTENLVVLGGLSYAQGGARQSGAATADLHVHQSGGAPVGAFAGGSRVGGVDLTLRWMPDSYREMLWQTEFLWRSLEGNRYNAGQRQALHKEQSGLYSEWVWRFDWQWRTGLRLDLLTRNDTWEQGIFSSGAAWLPACTAMLEFHPSEFSRFRLEYSYDQTRQANTQSVAVHSVFLQLNLSMGAHGAHNF